MVCTCSTCVQSCSKHLPAHHNCSFCGSCMFCCRWDAAQAAQPYHLQLKMTAPRLSHATMLPLRFSYYNRQQAMMRRACTALLLMSHQTHFCSSCRGGFTAGLMRPRASSCCQPVSLTASARYVHSSDARFVALQLVVAACTLALARHPTTRDRLLLAVVACYAVANQKLCHVLAPGCPRGLRQPPCGASRQSRTSGLP